MWTLTSDAVVDAAGEAGGTGECNTACVHGQLCHTVFTRGAVCVVLRTLVTAGASSNSICSNSAVVAADAELAVAAVQASL